MALISRPILQFGGSFLRPFVCNIHTVKLFHVATHAAKTFETGY